MVRPIFVGQKLVKFIAKLSKCMYVWPHPPYSPDLSPCDYHLCGPLKQDLGVKHFTADEEVQAAVLKWMV